MSRERALGTAVVALTFCAQEPHRHVCGDDATADGPLLGQRREALPLEGRDGPGADHAKRSQPVRKRSEPVTALRRQTELIDADSRVVAARGKGSGGRGVERGDGR